MTQFQTFDVFTERAFGGNPLAVITDASALPESALQKIAREFNYSETVFLYPPEQAQNTARVRIFTPTMEVPFAGHPTIGTAVALAQAGHGPQMVLELGVGPIRAVASKSEARFTTKAELEVLGHPPPALVARALGVDESDLAGAPVMASLGLAFTLTELKSRAALGGCQPDVEAFRAGAAMHPAGLDFAQFAYVREGGVIHARMFAPLDNIPEDPATGSAVAALAALLASEGRVFEGVVHQGDDMGRPSRIGVKMERGGVTISGAAVLVMEGRLCL
ncbi:PhzF family phenazine biosynthesis protein [Alphaproteobacteria bacterium KMM 3653]|uniref:PhzF family phenazine biosynthesis protein n=1 Tax=Harenicola maris TaxID=2841044 RepID=A0AAP2CNV5_9RHOB|nr:PhzF family phenazine biosynthesis protein [Harenicola maris]